MQEIIKGVNALATEELIRANKKHPLFHSDHEALGVIGEEVCELRAEQGLVEIAFDNFRRSVYTDREDWKKADDIKDLRKTAMLCACEAIQTVAMCDKYFMGKERKE